jgi:4-hydroxy-3-methylbut-2-enyl diphosphate reductase
LIDDADALDPAWLTEKTNIGLTAGASAPEALVLEVIEALRRIDADLEVSKMDGLEEHVEFRLPVELRT